MQWKATRRLLRGKPYLIDSWRIRSYYQAELLWHETGYPSAVSLLSHAQEKSSLSYSEWEEFIGLTSLQVAALDNKQTTLHHNRNIPRRHLLAVAIIALISILMACTPQGRAFVRNAYNAIVEFIDNQLIIRSSNTDSDGAVPIVVLAENEPTSFDSIESAAEYLDAEIYLLADYVGDIDSISVTFPYPNKRLECIYKIDGGVFIAITQIIGESQSEAVGSLDLKNGDYVHIDFDNGFVLDGVLLQADASFVGNMIRGQEKATISIIGVNHKQIIVALTASLQTYKR